jgi:ADP-ribose pyrophosphatase YjhB (NUDIX family)
MCNYRVNLYGGAEIDHTDCGGSLEEFAAACSAALARMRSENLKTAWLFLPPEQADFIPAALALGFTYHHADESGLQLAAALRPEAHIPGYATHFIGAGGVVLDDQKRILVVQERYHTRRHFKLPGGTIEPGEHIAAGVVREVFEETGIRTEFLSLHCARHWHNYRFGKSDIYFICRLKPQNSDIIIDEREIAAAVWMPVRQYLENPDTHPFNRSAVEAALYGQGLEPGSLPGFYEPETRELLYAVRTRGV